MTTRSAKGNPPTFAASVCFREAGFCNTSVSSVFTLSRSSIAALQTARQTLGDELSFCTAALLKV